jgi:hypothetical protein
MRAIRRLRRLLCVAATLAATSAVGQGVCPGDCNDDRTVGVSELVTGVNIVLGRAAVAACPAFDVNGNGVVAINELVTAVGSALNGCGGGMATFEAVQAIFTAQCATVNCHSGAFPSNSLDLTAGTSYDAVVGVTPVNIAAADEGLLRVDPDDANNSFLLIKVSGTPALRYGAQMPLFAEPLSESQVRTIRDWIEAGANP